MTHFEGEAIDEGSNEPLEHPNRLVHHQVFIQMRVQLLIGPLEHVLKNHDINIRERKTIFVEAQKHVPTIQSDVYKNPESVQL